MGERRLISVSEKSGPTLRERVYPSYVDNAALKTPQQGIVIAELKYLTRDESGRTDQDLAHRFFDVAQTMAEVEFQYGASEDRVNELTREFYGLMAENKFIPGGRVLTNAGTSVPSYFNCYVLDVPDSLEGIFDAAKKGALIHKTGGGTGYNFSSIRPRGVYIPSSKGIASGPVSFMEIFDVATAKINAGNRRGANMGILDIDHPDIMEFIYAKAARGKLTNFNISIGATDQFMDGVNNGGYVPLVWGGLSLVAEDLENFYRNIAEQKLGGSEVGEAPERPSLVLHGNGKEVIDSFGEQVIGRIGENGVVEIDASKVMDTIASLAWKTGDPGIIFLDRVNDGNPLLRTRGKMKATNPCGEQPLHSDDACNLGSFNLKAYVKDGVVDFDSLGADIYPVVRFMDNVNDANQGPLPEIEKTTKSHRRIGLGIMGLDDMLIELGIPYASERGRSKAEEVMSFITDTAKKASVELALEKGTFQPFEGSSYDDGEPNNRVRNLQRTTVAPTGSICAVAGVINGIEPKFGLVYNKNLRGGDSLRFVFEPFERVAKERGFYSDDLIQRIYDNGGGLTGIEGIPDDVRELFATASEIPVEAHVLMQAAIQRATDNAVSKTINLPNSATIDDIINTYKLAYQHGLKGITVYRDGSKDVQVLEAGKKAPLRVDLLNADRPSDVLGRTEEFDSPFGTGYLTLNWAYDPAGNNLGLYEAFINIGKAGEDIPAGAEADGRMLSMLFKSGIPVEKVIKQLKGIGGTTRKGFGPRQVLSLPDAIAKTLESALEKEEKRNGVKSGSTAASTGGVSRNFCPDCRNLLVREAGCECCHGCGYSKC